MTRRFATTTMSSKGQVVIPEEIRERLGLESGEQFLVMAENDVVVFKIISAPPRAEFLHALKKVRKAAKEAGITEDDLKKAVMASRRRK